MGHSRSYRLLSQGSPILMRAGTKRLLLTQLRVLGALILRETRATFGNSSMGYLWAIVTPIASIGVLVSIFSLAGRQAPYGKSLALFFATGVLTLELFNKLGQSVMTAFTSNRALFSYPPIKEMDAVYARVVLIGATYFVINLLLYTLLYLSNLADFPFDVTTVFTAFNMTVLLGASYGLFNAVLLSLWSSWSNVKSIISKPLFFISGVFYVPSAMPQTAQYYLSFNPILHLVEWIRTGFYPGYNSTVLDKNYVLFIAMVLLLFGLLGERIFRKKRF